MLNLFTNICTFNVVDWFETCERFKVLNGIEFDLDEDLIQVCLHLLTSTMGKFTNNIFILMYSFVMLIKIFYDKNFSIHL